MRLGLTFRVSPSLPVFYSRKPVVILSAPSREELIEEEEGDRHQDALDRHVEDVLVRPSTVRRTLKGLWSFLKTRAFTTSLTLSTGLICISYGRAS